MHAHQVFDLLRAPEHPGPESALRKAWMSTHGACKDALALALVLKDVPHSLEAFRHKVSQSGKSQDWLLASFYVVYVGMADGKEWGWNKAPYDSKKVIREELKPLYSLDKDGPFKDQTRFWSFKKVSNNMNKGPRIDEPVDGQELSFVLPAGTSFNIFLREDNYESGKSLFEGGWAQGQEDGMIDAYQPVILQLSGANGEQSAKGNGLKVRRVVPVGREVLNSFSTCFFSSAMDLKAVQEAAAELVPLKSVAKPQKGCPLLCTINERAFVYRDEGAGLVEILESGLDPELGRRLLVPEKMLLAAMHSDNVNRAMRMLSVAIGHKAVKCVFATEQNRAEAASDACLVVHLHVDLPAAMLFQVLQKSRVEVSPTSLPKNGCLTMCFGRGITNKVWDGSDPKQLSCLQWYAPNLLVPVASPDGDEILCHVVYEMDLGLKQLAGQRDVQSKLLLMDEVSGFHHLIKVFYAGKVIYDETSGLECEDPKLLVTWQLRPGLSTSPAFTVHATSVQRKRALFSPDKLDCINCGVEGVMSPEREEPTVAESEGESPTVKKPKNVTFEN